MHSAMRGCVGRACGGGRRWITVRASELSVGAGATLQGHVWGGHNEGVAISCPQSGRSIRYDRLRQASGNLAAWLSANSPPGPLTLLLPNSIELAVSALGALEAGVPLSALNPDSSKEELARSLAATRSPWLITQSSRVHNVLEAKRSLEEKNKEEYPLGIIVVDGEIVFNGVVHLADLVETEGPVTKKGEVCLVTEQWGPKGMQLQEVTEESLLAGCLQAGWPGLGPGDRLALCMPMFTQYGLSHGLLASLASGAELVLSAPWNLGLCVKKHKVAAVSAVSGALDGLEGSTEELNSLKEVTVGGPPSQALGPLAGKVVQQYGPPDGPVAFSQAEAGGGPARLGQPVPGTEARVTVAGGEVGPMAEGAIWVRGPQFGGAWQCTGDAGYFDPEGTFYLTRPGAVWVRGLPVWPAELEAVLQEHPGVAGAAVYGCDGRLVASVVPADPYQPPHGLQLWLASRTAPHKQISELLFSSFLPMTPDGQPDRAKLTALYHSPNSSSDEYVSVVAV